MLGSTAEPPKLSLHRPLPHAHVGGCFDISTSGGQGRRSKLFLPVGHGPRLAGEDDTEAFSDEPGMPALSTKAQYSAPLTTLSIVKTKCSEPPAACTVLGQASRQMVRPAPRSSSSGIKSVSSARLPHAAPDQPRLRLAALRLIRRLSRRKRQSSPTRTVPRSRFGNRAALRSRPRGSRASPIRFRSGWVA